MTGGQNLGLIRQIEANREFLLTVLSQNPAWLARAAHPAADGALAAFAKSWAGRQPGFALVAQRVSQIAATNSTAAMKA